MLGSLVSWWDDGRKPPSKYHHQEGHGQRAFACLNEIVVGLALLFVLVDHGFFWSMLLPMFCGEIVAHFRGLFHYFHCFMVLVGSCCRPCFVLCFCFVFLLLRELPGPHDDFLA